MKIFCIDVATTTASIAVVDGRDLLAEVNLERGRTRGEVLVPAAAAMLDDLGLAPQDLEAYAVGLGPGSFTGLRTGLAFVKGLAIANPRPTIGVPTLEVMALAAGAHVGAVLPVIDARKGEVFTALFVSDGEGEVKRESDDQAITPEGLAELAPGPVLVLGDGLSRFAEEIKSVLGDRATMAPESTWPPRASLVGKLALPRLTRGESDPIDTMVPLYVRQSDAELRLGKRR